MYSDDYNKSLGCVAISLASGLPVTSELLELHCRVDNAEDLSMAEIYAAAAVAFIEKHTNRAFLEQTYLESFGAICGRSLRLGRYPATEIVGVQYLDADLAWQTLDSETYKLTGSNVIPSIFELNSDESWPSFGVGNERLRITYKAGYASEAVIPPDMKQAVLFLTAHWNETRMPINIGNNTTEIPLSVRAAIDLLKIYFI